MFDDTFTNVVKIGLIHNNNKHITLSNQTKMNKNKINRDHMNLSFGEYSNWCLRYRVLNNHRVTNGYDLENIVAQIPGIQQVLPGYESYTKWQNSSKLIYIGDVTQEDRLNFMRKKRNNLMKKWRRNHFCKLIVSFFLLFSFPKTTYSFIFSWSY
jgi:hypothetical protein